MISHSLSHVPGTSGFKDDGRDRNFIEARVPGIVNNVVFDAWEYRTEVDGSPMPRYELCVAYDALVVVDKRAGEIRAELENTETVFETFTIRTQYERYTGFRAVDFYEENIGASIFRVHLSSVNPEKYWIQYYSDDFLLYLMENFDTRGVRLEKEDISEYIYL